MLAGRLILARDLLAPQGSIYVHLDHNVSHYVKILLDGILGRENYRNEIVWLRTTGHSDSKTYSHIHDTILFYTKSEGWIWKKQFTEYSDEYKDGFYRSIDADGRRYTLSDLTAAGTRNGPSGEPWRGIDIAARGKHWIYAVSKLDELDRNGGIYWPEKPGGMPRLKRYLDSMPGVILRSIWSDISSVGPHAKERTGYSTQKPEALLERIVKASSIEGSLVLDFFAGSGTTCVVAEKLGRRWIGCDLGRWGIHVTRKRLLAIGSCKPFEVLNLGRYERQYWQGVTFGSKGKNVTEQALYEYLAFMLKIYGAQPVSGLVHLHGKKGKAMAHIGAVDAPVTIDEINLAVSECLKLKQSELHVLGWEWEMGLNDLMVGEAKKLGVKLLLLQIPREVMEQQAVDKGDIQFFELAYLEVEIKKGKDRTVTIVLKDFVIPNTELIPEEVRSKVKKWSDYIDYWAVDWDFQNDTFMQGWVAYRTRKERKLPLSSDPHVYEKPGKYRILVKVIDFFGNDTSQAFDAEVK